MTSTKDSIPKLDLQLRWPLWLLALSVGSFVFFSVLDVSEPARAVSLAVFAAAMIASGAELVRRATIAFLEFWRTLLESRDRPACDLQLCIVSQAQAAGVRGVYTRFSTTKEGEEEIRSAVTRQFERNAGQLRVFGVAGKCLFHDEPGRDLFDEYMPKKAVILRAIMLDRKCPWAKVRDGLEGGHLTEKEIGMTFDYLRHLRTKVGTDKVQYFATDIPVPAFVLMTDEWAFVEPYPIAEVSGPLGGRNPLLKLDAKSPGYKAWSDTFELLWRYPKLDALKHHAATLAP